MRVLWLPHSDNPAYAGVRLRCLIPVSMLRRNGLPVAVNARFEDFGAGDIAVVQGKWLLDCGTSQAMAARLESLRGLAKRGCLLVLDCFDNYFLNENDDADRAALLQAFRASLPLFSAFTVSSPGLVPFFRAEVGATACVEVVGDPIEGPDSAALYEGVLQRSNPRRWPGATRDLLLRGATRVRGRRERQLLWFGNSGSSYARGGMAELSRVFEPLAQAALRVPLRLTVVSNSEARYQQLFAGARFAHRYLPWNRLYFARLLQAHDVVLLPSSITAFTQAKSNNRLLLPLSLGVPVVADALPDYLPWQEHFQLGGWERLADTLGDLQPLRLRAQAAMSVVRQRWAPQAIAQDWLDLFRRLLGGGAGH